MDAVESKSSEETVTKLSKNAQKKLSKRRKFEATKAEWKAKLKARKKQKRQERTKIRQSDLDAPEKNPQTGPEKTIQEAPQGCILIDLAFEPLMTDRETSSLASQICRCYAINRKTTKPFNLVISGLVSDSKTEKELRKAFPQYDRWKLEIRSEALDQTMANHEQPSNIIYLSADSENTLQEIDPTLTYVIGGLVDRNRHKNAGAKRAEALGLKTAKLPIGAHLKLVGSQVLTIVHVYELLCKKRELGSWPEALDQAIPVRKKVINAGE